MIARREVAECWAGSEEGEKIRGKFVGHRDVAEVVVQGEGKGRRKSNEWLLLR